MFNRESAFVIAYEPGAEHPSLPTWASKIDNPAGLGMATENNVVRVELANVPGAFQLLNVLTTAECKQLVAMAETLGYLPDAAVSLPRDIRHNDNFTWIADDATVDIIWQRVAGLVQDKNGLFADKRALGINARFRFYRYSQGDFFKPHSDGAWPGSRVLDDQLVADAYPDRYSQMSFLIFLSEDFIGGATRFLVNADAPTQPARRGNRIKEVDIRTPAGGILCFPHGMHPLHCIHSSENIMQGVKYIIRSDLLFEL